MNQNTLLFRQHDWQLFTNINTLPQKAGVERSKILILVAKELTDNALDTGTEVHVNYVKKQDGTTRGGHFFVRDKGTGIAGNNEHIARLFSINRPLISTKRLRLPYRGALGNGLRVVSGAMFSLGGYINVTTGGRTLKIQAATNGHTTFEILQGYDPMAVTGLSEEDFTKGTLIEFCTTSTEYDDLSNLVWANRSIYLNQGNIYSGQTSPFWYDSDSFHSLLETCAADVTVQEFISNFDGCKGIKGKQLIAPYQERAANSLTFEESEQLLKGALTIAKVVTHNRLGMVGKLPIALAYHKIKTTITLEAAKGEHHATLPVVLEMWAVPKKMGSYLFVNKTVTTAAIQTSFQGKYAIMYYGGLETWFEKKITTPLAIWINVITPYMPITSDGKNPNFKPLSTDINQMFEKVVKSAARAAKKMDKDGKVIEVVSQKKIIGEVLNQAVEKASGNGEYRFSLRQLYYAVRPLVKLGNNADLKYSYFCEVIGDIENEQGKDIQGMYRDNRGLLIEPHTGREMPLGTLSVERYNRPKWRFNKVLYIEKKGFFELLKSQKIGEKYDIALMSSEGNSTRAAKDLVDLLGESSEPTQFFCIHDADAAGTTIVEGLQKATRARGARTVEIIDLGLHPKEAIEMGLEIETFSTKKYHKVADAYWDYQDWFQGKRVELNAMSSPVFIKWIESKLDQYLEKVIPPDTHITPLVTQKTESLLKLKLKQKIMQQLNIDALVETAYQDYKTPVENQIQKMDFVEEIETAFEEDETLSWESPLDESIEQQIDEAIEDFELGD